MDNKSSYKTILKSTSIFGSVQLVTIITAIIKSKIITTLIGSYGYGIYSVLIHTSDLIKQISLVGIDVSGVRKIAEENPIKNKNELQYNIAVISKLVLISGFIGFILATTLSLFLSTVIFLSSSYWYLFFFLALAIFFNCLTAGNNAILQGNSKFSQLAKSNLISNIIGLILIIPFFYFFKIDAIIYVIIITAMVNYFVSKYFLRFLFIPNVKISFKSAIKSGDNIIKFGSLLMLLSFLPVLANYIIQIFIGRIDGLNEVGLFNVGIVILNTYVGFIFSAMSMEYYPRLVAQISDFKKLSNSVNQQIEISLLIITPILILFSILSEFFIKIFFSLEFIPILPMLDWAIFAMLFKAVSFPIGYLFIAKADSKVFVKTSIFFNSIFVIFCLFGYYLKGFNGLGFSFLIYYFIHLIGVYLISSKRYNLKLVKNTIQIFFFNLLFCLTIFILNFYSEIQLLLVLKFFVLSGSLVYSLVTLNKLVPIFSYFKKERK
ncbi:oligosaccharide flippase family protein [Flavobacterium sp.]|uniref:oligosaccharide flippase family protein n=1 Tax=Flavobacterium sp. TaxID=239 RepID=UPI0040482F14